jgi:hypothetical protein
LIDPKTNKQPPDLIYKRKGNSLFIEMPNGEFVELENFYSENAILFDSDSFSGEAIDLSSNVVEVSAETTTQAAAAELGASSAAAAGTNYIFPVLGGLGLAGAVAAATSGGGSSSQPAPQPEETVPTFEIFKTDVEATTLPFSMKVGDRLEVVRDNDGNITGYLLNGEPASEAFVAALEDMNRISRFTQISGGLDSLTLLKFVKMAPI